MIPEKYDEERIQRITSKIKYTKEIIGGGAFGEIFLEEMDGKQVAVKKIRNDYNECKELAFKEARALQKCQGNQNIVDFYGVDEKTNLVMEYMNCGNVLGFLEHADWNSCLAIALKVAHGLQHIHSKKLLHIDLKSSNILLNNKGEVKIGDFGAAVDQGKITERIWESGTVIYQPPEAYSLPEAKINFSYDIFSFGVFIGELITRSCPRLLAMNIKELIEVKRQDQSYQPFSTDQLKTAAANAKGTKELNILETLETLYFSCTMKNPAQRMSLEVIIQNLSECVGRIKLDVDTTLIGALSKYFSLLSAKKLKILEAKDNSSQNSHESKYHINFSLLESKEKDAKQCHLLTSSDFVIISSLQTLRADSCQQSQRTASSHTLKNQNLNNDAQGFCESKNDLNQDLLKNEEKSSLNHQADSLHFFQIVNNPQTSLPYQFLPDVDIKSPKKGSPDEKQNLMHQPKPIAAVYTKKKPSSRYNCCLFIKFPRKSKLDLLKEDLSRIEGYLNAGNHQQPSLESHIKNLKQKNEYLRNEIINLSRKKPLPGNKEIIDEHSAVLNAVIDLQGRLSRTKQSAPKIDISFSNLILK